MPSFKSEKSGGKSSKKTRAQSSNTVRDRTAIQLQSGPTKAYTKRNPQSQKLRPLSDARRPATSTHMHTTPGRISDAVLSSTALRFEHSILLEDYGNAHEPPGGNVSASPRMPKPTPRRVASEVSYRNVNMWEGHATEQKAEQIINTKPQRCQSELHWRPPGNLPPFPEPDSSQGRVLSGAYNDGPTWERPATEASRRVGSSKPQRCHSEMQWRPVVNITRNNTIILPSLSVEPDQCEMPEDPPPYPSIETTEHFDEWPGPRRFLTDPLEEDETECDRNTLLKYLQKGVRPSITPMNSIDSESVHDSTGTPGRVCSALDAPLLEEALSTAHIFAKSTVRVHCKETSNAWPHGRRPQVLKRVSIGDNLTLSFTKGQAAPNPSYGPPKWNPQRSTNKTKVRTSLPSLNEGQQVISRQASQSKPKSARELAPSARKKMKSEPSDDEIISMYRQGLLGTSTSPRPLNSAVSSNTNFPPTTASRMESANYDSQYSSPTVQSQGYVSPPELKAQAGKRLGQIETVGDLSEPSTRSSSSNRRHQTYADSESGISRGGVTNGSNEGSDSRKPSDPNCLQIPGISGPIVGCIVGMEETKVDKTVSEQSDATQVYWDSKSSTPAFLEPHDFDSRPHSCTSSLGDASLMLENDDLTSLPGSPFPGCKGPHPRLSRRSSSVDSGISRPGSDFLEVPNNAIVTSKDKLPTMMDSPGDSPIASPVSQLSDNSRYSEDYLQHQVIHRMSEGLPSPRCDTPPAEPEIPKVELERKGSGGVVAPAVSLTTDDGDDFAVWFGRRGSIFIEEKGLPPPPPQLQTTTDESGQVSLAVPKLE